MNNRLILFFLLLNLAGCTDHHSEHSYMHAPDSVKNKLRQKQIEYEKMLDENYDSSRIVLNDLLISLNRISKKQPKSAAPVYAQLAYGESTKQNTRLSDSLLRISLALSKIANDSSILCNIYLHKGIVLENKSFPDSAEFYYQKTIELGRKYRDTASIVPAMSNLGTLMLNRKNTDSGITYLKKAMSLCNNKRYQQNKADLCNNIGVAYERRGSLSLALDYYKKSIEILENINSYRNYLNPINNMANIYLELGNDSLSLYYYKKVNRVAGKIKNKQLEATSLVNLGNFYYTKKDFNKAYEYSQKAFEILKDMPDSYLHAILFLNMGIIEKEYGNFDKALELLQKSLLIGIHSSATHIVNDTKLNLAQLYLENKEYAKTEQLATEVYHSALKNQNLDFTYQTALILAKINKIKQNPQKALRYYELYENYFSQFSDTLNARQNRNFANQYELQKKEAKNKELLLRQRIQQQELNEKENQIVRQQILILLAIVIVLSLLTTVLLYVFRNRAKRKANLLLKAKNKAIKERNRFLKKENQFKNKLFSIVSHDIKSPLISLHNFLTLLEINELDQKEKEEMIRETMARTESTLNMVEDLLLWTRQQLDDSSIHYTDINFCDLADEVLALFHSTAKEQNVEIVSNCEYDNWIYSDPNIIKMLIRNLISNALKFTPEGGKIVLEIQQENGESIISVKDNGKGIPKEHQSKIFSENSPYTSIDSGKEKGHGIGLKLCKFFVEKAKGRIWFESSPKKGTSFFVALPNISSQKGTNEN